MPSLTPRPAAADQRGGRGRAVHLVAARPRGGREAAAAQLPRARRGLDGAVQVNDWAACPE